LGSHSRPFGLFKLAVLGICLLLVAAACGDGEQEAPLPTPTPPPSTPKPVPTVDPSVPLVEYRSPDMGYSMGYPEGWNVEVPSGPFTAFSWSLDGRPIAQLSVMCTRGENQTVDGLIQEHARIVPQIARTALAESTPIELGGTAGKQLRYTTRVAELTIEQVAAYAVIGDCGWRIGLATYGPGTLEPYLPLFERIIASFQPD
jgi:hypothetical protein